MSGSEEWRRIVEEISATDPPLRSHALVSLYQLACADARAALRSFSTHIREQAEDLAQDIVFEKLGALIAAPNPRALFYTAVRNAAIDLQRQHARRPRDEDPIEQLPSLDAAVESHVGARLELARAQALLTPRELDIFVAIAAGEERDDIARAFGTSRANIDQLVSRARKRLTEAP